MSAQMEIDEITRLVNYLLSYIFKFLYYVSKYFRFSFFDHIAMPGLIGALGGGLTLANS